MAGTTRLELATSAVTAQRPEVTSCNFTAPIATLGALRNPQEVLLHPNCTQIFRETSQYKRVFSVLIWSGPTWMSGRRLRANGQPHPPLRPHPRLPRRPRQTRVTDH